ncbi:hypothetical protein GCM10022407_38960 [Hymenobacter antarcticus]|uniref:Uncharacterized protein n=2 Tax=Hymenobacter antarcticus TaxID=486270 RepID=A0ABP7R0Y1_9BACT
MRFYSGTSLFPMKLRERYRQLQDPAVVKAMVVRSVYASMALEDQTVPVARLEALYEQTGLRPPAGATAR